MQNENKENLAKKHQDIEKELEKMRIAFLEDAIKKKVFSYNVLGDFKLELRKLRKKH